MKRIKKATVCLSMVLMLVLASISPVVAEAAKEVSSTASVEYYNHDVGQDGEYEASEDTALVNAVIADESSITSTCLGVDEYWGDIDLANYKPDGYDHIVEYTLTLNGTFGYTQDENQNVTYSEIVAATVELPTPSGYVATDALLYDGVNNEFIGEGVNVSNDVATVSFFQEDNNGATIFMTAAVAFKKASDSGSGNSNTGNTTDNSESTGNTGNTDNTGNGSTTDNTNNQNTQQGNTTPTVAPSEVGQESSIGNAVYLVTASGEVEYEGTVTDQKSVTIPSTVTLADGTKCKVTTIAANAFKGNKKITSVSIGKNIKTIEAGAFANCKNLKKVKLNGNNLKSVGKNAFKGAKSSVKITVLAKSKKIYNKVVKKVQKAGAKKATFKYKKSK